MSNNIEYIKEYNKEHYIRLQVYLKPDEMEAFEKALKKNGVTKAQYIKSIINQLINKK